MVMFLLSIYNYYAKRGNNSYKLNRELTIKTFLDNKKKVLYI
jgi:hypothetical protein